MRHQDQGFFCSRAGFGIGFVRFAPPVLQAQTGWVGRALHGTQHPLHNLFQVGFALPQIRVFHLVKGARQHLELSRHRPLRVVEALADPLFDAVAQGFVFQQHQVHIQQRAQFLRRVFGSELLDAGLQAGDFLDHRIAALAHPVNFAGNLLGRDEIVGHVPAAGTHQHRAAHDHAARHC